VTLPILKYILPDITDFCCKEELGFLNVTAEIGLLPRKLSTLSPAYFCLSPPYGKLPVPAVGNFFDSKPLFRLIQKKNNTQKTLITATAARLETNDFEITLTAARLEASLSN
jgi:hypothetical protein